MPEFSAFAYLADSTLDAVITELNIARYDLTFRTERASSSERVSGLAAELAAVTKLHLTAKAERTARLAIDPKVRKQLAEHAGAQAMRDALAAQMENPKSVAVIVNVGDA